jgi:hypothetical protein
MLLSWEFNWDFVAALRANGQTIHNTGRESQVYIRTPEKGWRLVHVHYSGPPIGGPSQGFRRDSTLRPDNSGRGKLSRKGVVAVQRALPPQCNSLACFPPYSTRDI